MPLLPLLLGGVGRGEEGSRSNFRLSQNGEALRAEHCVRNNEKEIETYVQMRIEEALKTDDSEAK